MDEREKLRKFRELDDAFAEALRELDTSGPALDISTGSPVRSPDEPPELPMEAPESRQQLFERRLRELMQDYAQDENSVSDLLRTLAGARAHCLTCP